MFVIELIATAAGAIVVGDWLWIGVEEFDDWAFTCTSSGSKSLEGEKKEEICLRTYCEGLLGKFLLWGIVAVADFCRISFRLVKYPDFQQQWFMLEQRDIGRNSQFVFLLHSPPLAIGLTNFFSKGKQETFAFAGLAQFDSTTTVTGRRYRKRESSSRRWRSVVPFGGGPCSIQGKYAQEKCGPIFTNIWIMSTI